MPTNQQLSKAMSPETSYEIKEMESIPYSLAIGYLLYLVVITQPDLSFVVFKLAQFMSNPGMIHWNAIKRIFRYLQGT
jgi:hypothetical protein